MTAEYLRIAIITGAHSLDGGLKVHVITDNPDRLSPETMVYLKRKGGFIKYRVEDFSLHKNRTGFLYLAGVTTREDAENLKGIELFIPREIAESTREALEEDSYYYYEILGCSVYLNDSAFGTVTDIMQGGAGEILIVQDSNGREHMIPFVEAMVETGRIREKRIDIHPVEGLLDL